VGGDVRRVAPLRERSQLVVDGTSVSVRDRHTAT
jgi:hypothetical protein